MRRRQFLIVAGALVPPLGLLAQKTDRRIRRIGLLSPLTSASFEQRFDAFRRGLRELGYREGENVTFEVRAADSKYDRLPALCAELIDAKVEVIVTSSSAAIRAAQQTTRTIPIVFAAAGDPVGSGFVASLAKPGGNLTGLSLLSSETSEKHLEFLRAFVPKLSQIAVLGNPSTPTLAATLRQVSSSAQKLGIRVSRVDVTSVPEIELAFADAIAGKSGGVIIASDAFFYGQLSLIAKLALKHRVPAISPFTEFVDVGGLISHGHSVVDLWRRAASYVDRIFKGALPGDLPVEQPNTFELAVNRGTAKALGLTIPQSILLRADRVIE